MNEYLIFLLKYLNSSKISKISCPSPLGKTNLLCSRYYTEQSDSEMDMWIVVKRTRSKFLTLVVTPFKVQSRDLPRLDLCLSVTEEVQQQ